MSSRDRNHRLLRARDWQDRPELEHLCDWWRDIGGGLYALVGIGGAGKTAVIDRFLQIVPGGSPEPLDPTQAPERRTDLPETVDPFVFSFYDVPNEDSFFVELAAWLERVDPDGIPVSVASSRGPDSDVAAGSHQYEKLSIAHLFQWLQNLASRRSRTLLVLDGLEKVQDDGRRSGMYGHINDGRLRTLLLDIAEGRFGRLAVVVTTRFDLYDPAAEGVPYYWREFVEQLHVRTCVALLRARGVKEPDDDVLKRLAEENGRHALTVDLIGGYIGEFCGGDVSQLQPLGEIDLSDVDIRLHPRRKAVIEQERRFARVAERYQESLREQEPATLALLQRLCLFRLGVDAATLTSIFTGDDESTRNVAGPALAALTAEQLQQTLDRLTAMKLVEVSGTASNWEGEAPAEPPRAANETARQEPRPPGSAQYSIHPAIRDGFLSGIGESDRTAGHEAARAGLSAALGDSPGENPSDPATLDLLEEIVQHTLESGHVQEAFDVYWNRIGNYQNLLWRLGAYERGERLCRAFAGGQPPEQLFPSGGFQPPSETTSPPRAAAGSHRYQNLPEADQAIFLNEWALYLHQLGRLEAAAHCYELNLELSLRKKNWADASRGNRNLCDVRLLSGRLSRRSTLRVEPAALDARLGESSDAAAVAEESLRLAELADDAEEQKSSYAFRGHARALLGEVPSALADFREALDWQHKDEGDDDPLYSGRGIRHTQLLARLGRREESQRLTEANQEILVTFFGATHFHIPQCRLILASLQLGSGDVSAAERLCHAARDWALARDAKEVLCWSALVQARIELAKVAWAPGLCHERDAEAVQHGPGAHATTATDMAESAIDDGLKIARACGFSLYHIDLQLELARLRLLQGAPAEALAAIRTALDETRPKNDETGEPELLAARDPNCGYTWPVPEALQLRAEALLLQAAQELGASQFDPEARDQLPAEIGELVDQAEACLNESLDSWRPLRDPARKNANFRHLETRRQYNFRARSTWQLLEDLQIGRLTGYPLTGLSRLGPNGSPSDTDLPPDPLSEEPAMALPATARSVFISYFHADNESSDPKKKWLDRLVMFLKPFIRQDDFTVCSDRDLRIGDNWHEHIQAHLSGAKAVVLMVSPDFLASDYIANNELPVLLKNAADKGVRIFPILIAPCAFARAKFKFPDPKTGPEEFKLSSIQSSNPPSETLVEMDEGKQSRVLTEVAEQIADFLNP